MKILNIINGWTTKMSGGYYHILKVGKYWNKDHEVTYLLPRLGYEFSRNLLEGRTIVYDTLLEKEFHNSIKVILLYFIRTLKTLFSPPTEKFDIIIAASHFLCDIIPALFINMKNPESKLIVFWHGLSVKQTGKSNYLFRKVNDFISSMLIKKFFSLIFVVNPFTKEYLIQKGVDDNRIVITSNGVEKIFKSKEKKVFEACFLGRLVKSKGIFDLVEIWKNIIKMKPEAKLAVIGDGPQRSQLENLIKREGLGDNISLFGHLNEKRFDVMRESKIFLFPSYAESWPIVVLEAMSCGLPVISYDLSELREIWKDSITYVPKGNKKRFAETVLNLLADEKRYYEISNEGLELSRKFLWRKIAQKELTQLESIN